MRKRWEEIPIKSGESALRQATPIAESGTSSILPETGSI